MFEIPRLTLLGQFESHLVAQLQTQVFSWLGSYVVYMAITKGYLSRLMTKQTKWHVRPAKTQINLGNRPVWSVFHVHLKGS